MWSDGYIAVDWGTTNRRAWRVEGGSVGEEFADDIGFTSVPTGGFPAEVARIRERLGDLPLLLGGMVGARGGWVPAPYLPCPLDCDTLAASLPLAFSRPVSAQPAKVAAPAAPLAWLEGVPQLCTGTTVGVPWPRGVLRKGDAIVEERRVVIAYVPGKGEAHGGLLFERDPAAYVLSVTPEGYEEP